MPPEKYPRVVPGQAIAVLPLAVAVAKFSPVANNINMYMYSCKNYHVSVLDIAVCNCIWHRHSPPRDNLNAVPFPPPCRFGCLLQLTRRNLSLDTTGSSPDDDGQVRLSWCRDGAYFVISSLEEIGNRLSPQKPQLLGLQE